ncbi:MAG: aromatic amino acid ammonia-lyase [Jatrophihabitantaceae bacterium]
MIIVDGAHLTAADIVAIAYRQDEVVVSAIGTERASASSAYANQVSAHRPIYGRSTGVGANRTISLTDPAGQALGLLRSHATSAGPLRSPERVRAMLGVRLNQLAAGGSGASPAVLDGLLQMLRLDALPPVRELGTLGTADLPALATTALALAGEVATTPALTPLVLGIGDALPFMSSNAATIADAALALAELRTLADAALVISALTFTAVDGNAEAFAVAVEQVTPFDGARAVCRGLRQLVGDRPPARIQDPFGLRALPQVQGAFLDRLAELEAVTVAMANAPSENPVLLPLTGVAHHGGFHAAYLAQALDSMRLALGQSAQLALARVTMFAEPANTGLAPFLGDGTAGASGAMIIEYVAASALAELRALAHPVALHTVTLSRGVEEGASFASIAATHSLSALASYRTMLACELVLAMRCIRMRTVSPPPTLTEAFELCAVLSDDVTDRELTADIATAEALLSELAQTMSADAAGPSA